MSTTISGRVGLLIKGLNLTNNSFAKSIQKSSSTINYIVDGKTKPGYDLLDSIFNKYPQVNPDWLMKGEGPMFRVGEIALSNPAPANNDYLRDILEEMRNLREQLTVKDRQMDKILDLVGSMGKRNSVSRRPNKTPESPYLSNTNLFSQVPVFD